MWSRVAISLLLRPSPRRAITWRSRVVSRTDSMIRALFPPVAFRAIWVKSELVSAWGSTSAPAATARMVAKKSSNDASFMMKPDAPACTYMATSSSTGRSPMMMTLAPGTSSWTVAVRLTLSRASRPKSRRTTSGLASRAFASASSTSADAARTLNPGWVRIIAAIPSRRSRLSSMRIREMGLTATVIRRFSDSPSLREGATLPTTEIRGGGRNGIRETAEYPARVRVSPIAHRGAGGEELENLERRGDNAKVRTGELRMTLTPCRRPPHCGGGRAVRPGASASEALEPQVLVCYALLYYLIHYSSR